MARDRAGSPLLLPAAEHVRRALESGATYPNLQRVQAAALPLPGVPGPKGVVIRFFVQLTPLTGKLLELQLPLNTPGEKLAELLEEMAATIRALPTGAEAELAASKPADGPANTSS